MILYLIYTFLNLIVIALSSPFIAAAASAEV